MLGGRTSRHFETFPKFGPQTQPLVSGPANLVMVTNFLVSPRNINYTDLTWVSMPLVVEIWASKRMKTRIFWKNWKQASSEKPSIPSKSTYFRCNVVKQCPKPITRSIMTTMVGVLACQDTSSITTTQMQQLLSIDCNSHSNYSNTHSQHFQPITPHLSLLTSPSSTPEGLVKCYSHSYTPT